MSFQEKFVSLQETNKANQIMIKDVESKYKGKILSETDSIVNLTSKSSLNIHSKTEKQVLADARKAKGADEIIALAGVFSKCRKDVANDARLEYLLRKNL